MMPPAWICPPPQATTLKEYKEYVEKDKALERRFQQVMALEPTVEDTVSILRGLKERYEVHHGVRLADAGGNNLVNVNNATDRNYTHPLSLLGLTKLSGHFLLLAIGSLSAPRRGFSFESIHHGPVSPR